MTEKFNNRYRIPSARLESFDYGSAGMYFITICTKDRECFFGKIDNGVLVPTLLGEVVKSEWLKTPEIRGDMNIELGEFVVMPNHFHAVLIIGNNPYNTKPITVRNLNCNTGCNGQCNSVFNICGHFVHNSDFYDIRREAMHCVSTNLI